MDSLFDVNLGRELLAHIRWGLSADGITARDKVVLMALIVRANRVEKYCFPGLQKLSDDTSLPVQSVSKSIQNLRRAGLIEVERRGKKQTNFYVILCPDAADE